MKQFRCVIDYSTYMEEFYEALASVTVPAHQEDSFQSRMLEMQPDDVLRLAIDCLERTIAAGAYDHGIGFIDIANLHKHPEVRRSLYIYQLHSNFEQIYHPVITPTEQYHLDTLEGAMTDALEAYFGGATRTMVRGSDDVILWRVLLGCLLETARSISLAGSELGVSEVALMNYAISDIHPHGQDTHTYILVLDGP